jgi:hypothetical protein
MKVHIFQKNPKRSVHMKAHNIILKFSPSGMCDTNIYGEIEEDPKASKFQG